MTRINVLFGEVTGSLTPWALALLTGLLLSLSATAQAGPNLAVNGSFDQAGEPLAGWKSKYDAPGESWYAENEKLVSVVPQEGGRKSVLRLNVATQFLADNPGVKVDSQPIPVAPGGHFRFSAYARSTGPECRLLIEGYKWKPGIKPHDNPTLLELRKCYRAAQLYFGPVKAGGFGGVGPDWRKATTTMPEGALGKQAQDLYNQIQFLVVHMVGIGGKAGDLFVDDVVVERQN